MTPALTRLDLAADPERWRDAGFTVDHDEVVVGAVVIRFVTSERDGLVGWELDGDVRSASGEHANGAVDSDHVVLMTPDLDETVSDLAERGFDARRTRDAGAGVTQVFYRFANGPILEVVGPVASPNPHLWGVVFDTGDLDATVERLGPARTSACSR